MTKNSMDHYTVLLHVLCKTPLAANFPPKDRAEFQMATNTMTAIAPHAISMTPAIAVPLRWLYQPADEQSQQGLSSFRVMLAPKGAPL